MGLLTIYIYFHLAEIEPGKTCKMVAVKDDTAPFLPYVVNVGLGISRRGFWVFGSL